MQKLGPYEVRGEIGRGAMGIVYHGWDPVIRRPVALKTLLAKGADADDWKNLQERLFREARTAGALSHPGIVTIYQVGQDETGLTYVAMEYVDGVSLAQGLRQVRPSVGTTLKLLRQAAEALDYAHRQGIVHRDVKPANLLIQRDNGLLKVADFGIARVLSQVTTASGHTAGSPAYMSPEQIQSRPLDGRSDQYSLAVVAYEMLTGDWPFNADSVTSLAFKSVYEAPQLHLLNDIPCGNALRPALERALAKMPAERFPTCAAFVAAMAEAWTAATAPAPGPAASGQPVSAPPVAAPRPKAARWGPGLAMVGVAAGVLLLVAGIRHLPGWMNQKSPAAKELAGAAAAAPPAAAPAPVPKEVPAAKPQAVPPAPKIETPKPAATVSAPRPKPEPAPAKVAELRPLPELNLPRAVRVEPRLDQAPPPPAAAAASPAIPAAADAVPGDPPKPVVITPITVIEQVSPGYTEQARREGIEGVVVLEFDVGEAGIAENVRVVRSIDPGLDREAAAALARWRFRPATADGKPLRKRARASMEFKLERPAAAPSLRKK